MLRIIQHRSWFFLITAVITAAALGATLLWGLKLGVDFTGGTLQELSFAGGQRPGSQETADVLKQSVGSDDVLVQPLGEDGLSIRMPAIDEEKHQAELKAMRDAFEKDGRTVTEKRFDSVGPVIGEELRRKTFYALGGAILAIVLYITWVFRKVSYPVASWKFGVCTVAALLHDVIVPVGLLSVLGHFYGLEVGAWVVTALLTVVGFSVHDTIVVFDRIREHLAQNRRDDFEQLVNRSINETMARSINTTLTVLLVLAAAWTFGGLSTRDFIMTMFVGILAGTYSSIFLASPLLVTWQLHDKLRKAGK